MRKQGASYGYVTVPKGGLRIDGVSFPEGPRAAGKKGWFKLLLINGAEEISQAEYEDQLTGSQSLAGKGVKDAEPVQKPARKRVGKRAPALAGSKS